MNQRILVTGGTGTLGRSLVPMLLRDGRQVVLVGRRDHAPATGTTSVTADLGDAASVQPVAAAMSNVGTVLHLAGSAKGDDVKTRHLLEAIETAGKRPHLIYISVVGADRTPVVSATDRAMFGYVKAKRDCEKMIADSGLPFSIVRATQFHTFGVELARAAAKMPIVVIPAGTRAQLIDGGEVAARLTEIALSGPTRWVEEMAGPTVYGMAEVVRSYLRAVGKRRPVIGLRLPGQAAAAFRAGANLNPERAVGQRTWEQYLTETVTNHAYPAA